MSASYARQISEKEAIAVAEKFMAGESGLKAPMRSAPGKPGKAAIDNQPYYIFNADDDNGFVIVSGDDRARKILGYADKGHFDADNIPPQLSWLLGEYANQIATLPSSAPTDPSWTQTTASRATNEVFLETANWGQGAPYNALTPEFNGQHAPTGCVATAMAIVMKHHNWPPKGQNTHTYYDYASSSKVSVQFSDIQFDWNKMDDISNTDGANEVAKLMKAAGQSVCMYYNINESGAKSSATNFALFKYFDYDPKVQLIEKKNYTTQEWDNILQEQISNTHPLIYFGNGTGAHAFIVDGYNSSNLYHINWGWDGSYNGWFELDALNPGNNDYNSNSSALIDIYPRQDMIEYADVWLDETSEYACPYLKGKGLIGIIENGKIYNAYISPLWFPPYFEGEITIAVIDKDNNIKKMVTNGYISCQETDGNYCGGYQELASPLNISCEILPSDKIKLFCTSKDSRKLLPVRGATKAPAEIMVSMEAIDAIPITWEIDNYSSVEVSIGSLKDKTISGSIYSFSAKTSSDRHIMIFANDKYDMTRWDTKTGEYVWANFVSEPSYHFKIQSIALDEMIEKEVNVETMGTLNTLIPSNEFIKIKKLKITGKINHSDMSFIYSNLINVMDLDLKDVEIDDSSILQTDLEIRSMKSMILPSTLKRIESNAFMECAFTEIELPESIEYIGEYAMPRGLKKARTLNPIPAKISEDAFKSSYGIGSDEFNYGVGKDGILVVPVGSKEVYENALGWNFFSRIIESDADSESFSDVEVDGLIFDVMGNEAILKGYTDRLNDDLLIPETISIKGKAYPVTTIADEAFHNNHTITSIKMPNSITSIGEYIFKGCDNLETVSFSDNIPEIYRAFYECEHITEIHLPKNLKKWVIWISGSRLKELNLPDGIEEISVVSFGYSELEKITLSSTNEHYIVKDGALYSKDYSKLILYPRVKDTPFSIPSSVTEICRDACSYGKWEFIEIPESVSIIEQGAFGSCYDLKTLILNPELSLRVKQWAFNWSNKLETIFIGKNVAFDAEVFARPYDGEIDIFYDDNNSLNRCANFFKRDYNNIDTPLSGNTYVSKLDAKLVGGSPESSITYVPGRAKDLFDGNVIEMWDYSIDKESNIIRIKPKFDDIIIDKVIINEEEIHPSNYLYHYTPNATLHVEVQFTPKNIHQMTTIYNDEFNSSLPDTPLSGIDAIEQMGNIKVNVINGTIIITDSDIMSEAEIFNTEGILIYKGTEKEIGGLNSGLYFVRIQGKSFKVVIK